MILENKFWITLKDYSQMVHNPLMELTNAKNVSICLRNVLNDLDNFFGSGKETQTSYLKFMSKGDESDSADDEPEVWQIGIVSLNYLP